MNPGSRPVAPLDSYDDVRGLRCPKRELHSATHEEILGGLTTDVYFVKARDVLKKRGVSIPL